MKHVLKIAGATLLVGILIFFVSKSRNSEKEVIIKVKAAKTSSYTSRLAATCDLNKAA